MTEEKRVPKPHNVILENRKSIILSGVLDVDNFDEQTVTVYTDIGELTIQGSELHIDKLSIDTGEMTMQGQIRSLTYSDESQQQGGGLFSRLFK